MNHHGHQSKRKLDTNATTLSKRSCKGFHGIPVPSGLEQHAAMHSAKASLVALSTVLFETPESPPRFIDGTSLFNLLVAVGPVFSKKIRHCYLYSKEEYLAKQLRILRQSMADVADGHTWTATDPTSASFPRTTKSPSE